MLQTVILFVPGSDLSENLLEALIGELGLGEDQPKSATKPVQVIPLAGVEVFE
jgi:hypothetical protein